MTREDAIRILIECEKKPDYKHTEGMIKEACKVASESLENVPLTLEELSKMDGEPVWVVKSGYKSRYALVDVSWRAKNVVWIVYSNRANRYASILLESGWKMYRYRT